MGYRLRLCQSKTKGLGGKGKLTGKMIDKLTVYYGLAIRRNCESMMKMKNAIWATYYHYSSSDEFPQHDQCPVGAESWCTWQRAFASDKLASYSHDYKPLPSDVLTAIKLIYVDLSKEELLERCIGGFNQNNNESYNQVIWKMSPKIVPSGFKTVELAANIAACVFNKGSQAILEIYTALGIQNGPNAHRYVELEDLVRIQTADRRTQQATREDRMARRQHQLDILEATTSSGNVQYGPGIDDSM